MVATRRQVQAGPEEEMEDPDLILKKKPVRKAAAKTATTKKVTTKATSTRSKKAEPEPDMSEADPIQELEKPATRRAGGRAKKTSAEVPEPEATKVPAKPARATKAGSLRGKKAAMPVEEVLEESAAEEPKPAKPTKTGSVRDKKAAAIIEEAPALPAPEEPKATRSTKGGSVRGKKAVAVPAPEESKPARQTRGAAPKAQPLSPKKITQVSKPQTRNTRNTNQKPATKAAQAKPATKGRGATKKRTVSDENADVPDFNEPSVEAEDDDVVMIASTPVKTMSTRSKANQKKQEEKAESEASMSSRPTTPNDSAAQSFNTIEEEDVEIHENDESAAEDEASIRADDSEDELCGPKTPMKRSSPGAFTRYQSSVQRTIRKYEDENNMQTPARRFAVLGTQRGTPQTQKPYCKPTAPSSGNRPMTVSRGMGRAFVFKDLRDGAPALPESNEAETETEEEDMSFLPDENIIPVDDESIPEEPILVETRPESPVEVEQPDTVMGATVEDEDDFVAPAIVQKYPDDPDDTVIMHDEIEDEVVSTVAQDVVSFDTEDTVLIHTTEREEHAGDEDASSDDDMSDAASVIIHTGQEPIETEAEANMLEHHEQGATISFNFDQHLANARPLYDEATEHMDVEQVPSIRPQQEEQDAVAGAEMHVDQEVQILQDISRRQTVNFNEFIDVAALSEPTAVLNIDEAATREATREGGDSFFEGMGDSSSTEHKIAEDVQNQAELVSEEDPARDIEDIDFADLQSTEEHAPTELEDNEPAQESTVPHYALPTIAFVARRKSLEPLSARTPIKIRSRPSTSDGVGMPPLADPFATAGRARSRAGSTVTTPVKPGLSTPRATRTIMTFGTPSRVRPAREAAASTPKGAPKERYPNFPPRKTYEGHANTVAPPARFGTPSKKSPKRRDTFHQALSGQIRAGNEEPEESTPAATPVATPKDRYPALRPRGNYEEHAKTVAAPVRFQTPAEKSPKRRETFHKAASGQTISVPAEPETPTTIAPSAAETPEITTNERYPRLRPRQNYEDHAKTVAGPVRFQTPDSTPVKTPLKRPATVSRPNNLRKAAMVANTPVASHPPTKTPLKAAAMTPGQVPMTPHPAAPLRGIVALVEVFTLEGASASAPFVALLHRLGAKTTKSWTDRITHVIFKDGSPTTLQRVRLNNKEAEEKGVGALIHCVNSRWVTDCDTEGARMDESGEAYVVDIAEVPRGGKRRRKSMEPAALLNLGGNIVRDRKSSIGRTSSLSRSPLKFDSPAKKVPDAATPEISTPDVDVVGKENSGDEMHGSSPATPAWISAPGQLVQQTAPMKRVRKLELEEKAERKTRRLTFWNGVA